jgi:hypothetical protein
VSLSTNASLNFSATDNSEGLKRDEETVFRLNPHTAHVVGSISLTVGSSNVILCNASLGTADPLKPKGDGLGFTAMRGHSVDKISKESLSIFSCRNK